MREPIEFDKLSGSGNDFVCIDNRDGAYDGLLSSAPDVGRFAAALCHRGLGVGADGVIFAVRPSDSRAADVAVRFFEPDGSEVELCGNGTACFARWVVDSGWVACGTVHIETPSGIAHGHMEADGYVRACIPHPHSIETDIAVTTGERSWTMDFAVTGVPHAVVFVDDVEALDVVRWGRAIRHHERFGPRGVNVNFTQVLGVGQLAVRTFEFGVEDETLACGTGCATAALLSVRRFGWPQTYLTEVAPIEVRVHSGDTLRLHFLVREDETVERACLETVVRPLYHGTLGPALLARALGTDE